MQRVRGPDDTGSGSRTDARPPPGPVLPLHVFFSPFSPQVFFISKRAARCCSLPRVSPARAQTPQGARGCVCVCIQAGGRGRGALTPRLCSECRLGSQRPACRALVLALTRLKSLNSRNEKVLPVTLTLLGERGEDFAVLFCVGGGGTPEEKTRTTKQRGLVCRSLPALASGLGAPTLVTALDVAGLRPPQPPPRARAASGSRRQGRGARVSLRSVYCSFLSPRRLSFLSCLFAVIKATSQLQINSHLT